jgi:hypothetical protein
MKTLNVIGVIVAVTIIIALAGIAIAAAAAVSLLLVQSASATTDVTMTNTTAGGEQDALSGTPATNNTKSNALLGDLFMIVEFETANINPINETYIEISTVSNATIIPPNTTGGTTINATETANATLNILPNGLGLTKGQSLLMTEGDDDGDAEQENATSAFVGISRITPDGPEGGTDVVFFNTNSTGQLAFLDNMIGIMQSEFSPGGGTIRTWEWKGADLPFGNEGDDGITATTPEEPPLMNTTRTNATTAADTNATAAAPEEEEGEGNEEGEDPNEFEDCVVPPGRDPGDVGC